MKKAVLKFTALCLAAGITFTGTGSVAFAAGDSSLLAGFAASSIRVVPEATQSETEESQTQTAEASSQPQEVQPQQVSEGQGEAVQTEPTVDTSLSGELAFAQCEEYINIRTAPSTDSEVVGKIYNNGSVTILRQVGDWYEVESGNAVGYVLASYFAIGEHADQIADEVAYNVATVYPEALVIRSAPSEDAESIGMAYSSDELEVVAYEGDWMKVALGGGVYGYVNAYYVSYDTYYATAETLEEEQARLDQEWLDYLAAEEAKKQAEEQAWLDYLAQQEAEQKAAEEAWLEAINQQQSQNSSSSSSSTGSVSDAQAAADAAYQEYLAAQAEADAATQQADEQLVYSTAAIAQEKYQKFLELQAIADQVAAGNAGSTSSDNTYTDDSYTDDMYTDDSYTDNTYTDDSSDEVYDDYYDDSTEDDVYYDESADDEYYEDSVYEEDSSSSYSLGQQIVDYATQFVGNPYVWGGTSLTNGADCSGFVQSVFANFGIGLPRTAASQAGSGTAVDLGSIQAGDLLFYYGDGYINHVTLYMGNGQVVHASNSNTGIIISDYGYRTPTCARRYW